MGCDYLLLRQVGHGVLRVQLQRSRRERGDRGTGTVQYMIPQYSSSTAVAYVPTASSFLLAAITEALKLPSLWEFRDKPSIVTMIVAVDDLGVVRGVFSSHECTFIGFQASACYSG